MKIDGNTALVTGGSSGIGAAVARQLAKKGAAQIILIARSNERLEKTATEVRGLGAKSLCFSVDLRDPGSTEKVIKSILMEVGSIDILVNCAGVGRWLFAQDTPLTEAEEMLSVPYRAAFMLTRAFLPQMLKQKQGHIVNLSSPAAYVPIRGATAYTASRWAIRGLHEALSMDLYGSGVDVTLVAPSVVEDTGYLTNNPGVEDRLPSSQKLMPKLSAHKMADLIVRAIQKRQKLIIAPWPIWVIVWMHKFTPGLVEWLVIKTSPKTST